MNHGNENRAVLDLFVHYGLLKYDGDVSYES